jgi:hypothetical protein
VKNGSTGFLLPLPTSRTGSIGDNDKSPQTWASALKSPGNEVFKVAAKGYAELLVKTIVDSETRRAMGRKGASGVDGWTWWDAMEVSISLFKSLGNSS